MDGQIIDGKTETILESSKVVEQPKPDLITRASQVKVETKPEVKESSENPFGLTREDYERVKSNPELSKLYKSMESGYQRKSQSISNENYHLQKEIEKFSNWTPERVQSLINDPKFVEAAKNVVGTQQEQSYESETDKRVKLLEQELNQLKGQSIQQTFKQQDEQLKQKYANYKPEAIDILTNDMLQGKVQATREHLWKVLDYEEAVNRAYQLGKQDRQTEMGEKISSASYSPNSSFQSQSGEKPVPEKGESDRDFLKRMFFKNAEGQKK